MMNEDRRIAAVDLASPRRIPVADRPIAPPEEDNEAADSDFEFAFAPRLPNENFYPVFGRAFNNEELLIEKLEIDDDDDSSESDEPAPKSYCEWSPNLPDKYQKRSSSTGSAGQRRWRLKDILAVGRSRSDGKERFLFVPPHDDVEHEKHRKKTSTNPQADPTVKMPPAKGLVAAHRAFYGNNDKARRSFLPYRPELVGIGLGRTRRHF